MDKIKINNQVVIMRKFVKQAKVRTINKLVKQVKLLQNRKGDETQVEKCKRKAERYLEEITVLKSIKPDNVSRSALSKARDWKKVLQQKTSTLDERCLAMLANYEAVQKEVESFHSSNPNLVTKIPSLVKEWEEKSKLPKNSPFDKRKKKLDTNNSWKENSISSNAFEKSFDTEVSPSSDQKFKAGIYENNITQPMSIEGKEHEPENLQESKNQSKFNSSKLINKISPLNLYENIKADKSFDGELKSSNGITQGNKKCKTKCMKKSKTPTNEKIKNELIYNKLQSKISPVEISGNVESDKSSAEDLRSDNDVTQEYISDEGEENSLKKVKTKKDEIQQKSKHKLISNKLKSKIAPAKFFENTESDKSSDEDLKSDDDVTQEYISDEGEENSSKKVKSNKDEIQQKSKYKLISNKLQSKIAPTKFFENTESDKSSDEDIRSDNDVTQEDILNKSEQYQLKRGKKIKKEIRQKAKCKWISNKLQSKNYCVKSSKHFEFDKSSDEELSIDGEDSANYTDCEEEACESDHSESIEQTNATEFRGRLNENNVEKLKKFKSGDKNNQRVGEKRKFSETLNISAEGIAGKEPDVKMLGKPVEPKQILSNSSVHSYRNMKENNLKTIAMLNLDDLQELDEIPVEEKTDHEENSDEDEKKFSSQERKDDFFIRKGELDSNYGDKVNAYSKKKKYPAFPRNDELNFEKKSFPKSLNTSQFYGTESYKFNNEKKYKRNDFAPRFSADRFQHKDKREFQNNDNRVLNRKERRALQSGNQGNFHTKGKNYLQSRDQKDSNKKEQNEFQLGNRADFIRKKNNDFQAFGKKLYNEQSRESNFQNEKSSSFRKDRLSNIKGNAFGEKPLHPSWEAKRKQKLTQTQFQGKKMVFEN